MNNQAEHHPLPVPFDAIDRRLTLSQKLAIARVPVAIGFVPNPRAFSNRQDADTNLILNVRLDRQGIHHELLEGTGQEYRDPAKAISHILRPFFPTLSRIALHHAEQEPNIMNQEWHLRVVRQPAKLCPQGEEGLWHLDMMHPKDKSSVEYIVSDCFGTEFLSAGTIVGELDKSRSTDSLVTVEQLRKAFAQTAAQYPDAIFQALPYQIVQFDETLPHRARNTASNIMRTMLRLVFVDS